MNPMKITDAIPHRAPFLLVDEIVEVHETKIRTRRRVDPEEPVFKGHFPNFPILPGVFVCESLFQSGALLIAHRLGATAEGSVPVLTRISNAKFKHAVRPGDTLDLEVVFKEQLGNAVFMSGTAKVAGKLAVSIDFACAAVARSSLEAS